MTYVSASGPEPIVDTVVVRRGIDPTATAYGPSFVGSRPRRRPGVHWVDVDGDVVAIDAEDGAVHTMSGATAIIWRLLDGRRYDELVDDLAAEHSLDIELVRTDVDTALGQLADGDLLAVPVDEMGDELGSR